MITEYDYIQLQAYEKQMYAAVYTKVLRGIDIIGLMRIRDIYVKYYSKANVRLSCGPCNLKMVKRIGIDYFNYEENILLNEEDGNEHT